MFCIISVALIVAFYSNVAHASETQPLDIYHAQYKIDGNDRDDCRDSACMHVGTGGSVGGTVGLLISTCIALPVIGLTHPLEYVVIGLTATGCVFGGTIGYCMHKGKIKCTSYSNS